MKYLSEKELCQKSGMGGISMKVFHTRKQFLCFFMPGFIIGIVYVNFFAVKYMADPVLFSTYFLEEYQSVDIVAGEYMWYLIRVRVFPLLVLAGFSLTKAKKAAAVLFLVWAGISAGILISLAAVEMGIKGCLLCVTGLFPQFLFYVPAYLVLLWYACSGPAGRWNRHKTVFVSLMTAIGMILEIYVNPILIRMFISTL